VEKENLKKKKVLSNYTQCRLVELEGWAQRRGLDGTQPEDAHG
jgi:hypothetical protein